jgi:protoporphyrin/coproporphyrin ferrochelatase
LGKLAVVLFNLGGPDGPAAVEPFLFNLFNDPAIIRLPGPLRWPIATIISRRRAPIAREIYRHLGGGSPLLANTEAQAASLQGVLGETLGAKTTARVFVCMRYWHPLSAAVAAAVKEFDPDQVLLLPLYPQFSTTTTASSDLAWRRAAAAAGLTAPTRLVCCYPTEPGFIAALTELTKAGLAEAAKLPGRKPRLIFSAHGLPVKIVKAGDPYVDQAAATCRAVAAALGLSADDWELGFQSRVGPVEWVRPATDTLIKQAAEAKQPIVVVPVAFVSEHSETLVELDIEYRKLVLDHGAPAYVRVPTVAIHPAFIAGLARLVGEALADAKPSVVGFGNCAASAQTCPYRRAAAAS